MKKTKAKKQDSDFEKRKMLLSELHEDPANLRIHGEKNIAAVKASLQEFKQYLPLIIQKSTSKIIIGNCRYQQMIELGWKEADCVVMDISDARSKALGVVDNRSAELGEWDMKALNLVLEEIDKEINIADYDFAIENLDNIDLPDIDVDLEAEKENDAAKEATDYKLEIILSLVDLANWRHWKEKTLHEIGKSSDIDAFKYALLKANDK